MNQSVPLRLVGTGLAHVLSDVLQPASQTIVAGTLYSVYLGLFTAWPGFSLALQMWQITEPGFGGYARKKITWGDEGVDKSLRPQVMATISQFQPTDSSASANILGAFVADAASAGNLLAIGLLTNPVVLGTPLDLLGVLPRFAIPGSTTPDWGEIVGVS